MRNTYAIADGKVQIDILKYGKFFCHAIVDIGDLPKLLAFDINWRTNVKPNGAVYIQSVYQPTRETIQLHRFLMDAPKGVQVDHIDRNPLNNSRENLRLTDETGNARNRGLNSKNKSGHAGVCAYGKFWKAYIYVEGKEIFLGYHLTLKDAITERKLAEKKYWGVS
jgi:HNH endonuclease